MTIHYSASTGGFYHSEIHADIPADAIEIEAAYHRSMLLAQTKGARIVAGADGRPEAIDPVAPSIDLQRAWMITSIKTEAQRRILAVAPIWRQLNDFASPSEAGTARRAEIDRLRAASDKAEARVHVMTEGDVAAFDPGSDILWA